MTWPATWRPLAHARCAWWRQRQKDQRSELSVLYLFCGLTSVPKERGFKMAFLNIFSLPKKIVEIRYSMSEKNIDLIAFNET